MYFSSHNPVGLRLAYAVESGDGSSGLVDVRYLNDSMHYRRLTGRKVVAAALAYCKANGMADRVYHGGSGMRPDDVYEVPREALEAVEPACESPARTWK